MKCVWVLKYCWHGWGTHTRNVFQIYIQLLYFTISVMQYLFFTWPATCSCLAYPQSHPFCILISWKVPLTTLSVHNKSLTPDQSTIPNCNLGERLNYTAIMRKGSSCIHYLVLDISHGRFSGCSVLTAMDQLIFTKKMRDDESEVHFFFLSCCQWYLCFLFASIFDSFKYA